MTAEQFQAEVGLYTQDTHAVGTYFI